MKPVDWSVKAAEKAAVRNCVSVLRILRNLQSLVGKKVGMARVSRPLAYYCAWVEGCFGQRNASGNLTHHTSFVAQSVSAVVELIVICWGLVVF